MNKNNISVAVTENNIHIENSYLIEYKEDMIELLEEYRRKYNSNAFYNYIINKRSIKSMTFEWDAHNLLYKLVLFKSRTKDVDIDDEKPYRIFCYYILGYVWFMFYDKYEDIK